VAQTDLRPLSDLLARRRSGGPGVGRVEDKYFKASADARPVLDRSRMSATVVISTEEEDRSRDVVITRGIETANHRNNPVVLLEHAQNLKLPVGRAQDPHGGYTVELHDGYATGTTWFSQHSPEAEQVYRLVDEGILAGASIGFRPLDYEVRHGDYGHRPGEPTGLLLKRVELLEYSHVVIPDNPHCVSLARDVLGKGRLAGAPLCDTVAKSLTASLGPICWRCGGPTKWVKQWRVCCDWSCRRPDLAAPRRNV
jgi:phage head maturation protease